MKTGIRLNIIKIKNIITTTKVVMVPVFSGVKENIVHTQDAFSVSFKESLILSIYFIMKRKLKEYF